MRPDKPPEANLKPEENLKPERIQDQGLEVIQPETSRIVAILEWIETWARRLWSLFAPDDSDQQS